jgi:hypothetical protein
MMKTILASVFLFATVMAEEGVTTTPAPVVAVPVASVSVVAESVKLASKDWRNYKGCDDTCFSLCLENPTGYESKCSILFSNNTLVNIPSNDSCRKPEIIQACSYQCQCACKRCGFCKQELVNSCADDKDPQECFENVIDNIINEAKCD